MNMNSLNKMSKPPINIVWVKRDIRLADHEGFYLAEQVKNDYIPLYVFDPNELAGPDSSLRHRQFVYHSLKDSSCAKTRNDCLGRYPQGIAFFGRYLLY